MGVFLLDSPIVLLIQVIARMFEISAIVWTTEENERARRMSICRVSQTCWREKSPTAEVRDS